MINTFKVDQARGTVYPLVMTETTTYPSNVMEHVQPRQLAVGWWISSVGGDRVNQRFLNNKK
jgi:hypothetical protein